MLTESQRAIADRYRLRCNRSLSKGDVLRVGQMWLACTPAGFDEIEPPAVTVITPEA